MNLRIINNQQVTDDYFLLEAQAEQTNNAIELWPGQFFHIKVSRDSVLDPLLRRPISLHDANIKEGRISFLYRVVGRGTALLSRFQKGEILDALGPLGNGFNIKQHSKEILMIGGGMGIAPLYYLSKCLANNNVTLLIGGNNIKELEYFKDIFTKNNIKLDLACLDGSAGYQGTVIDLFQEKYFINYQFDFIYSCGPEQMLKKIQEISAVTKIQGEISLEERMGCGIGVCVSCICQTTSGNQRVCKEGPVFPLSEVIFDESN